MTASSSGIPPSSARPVPVSREEYFAGLARKRMAAGVLFRDAAGRVLLVEPSYKSNWEIPGGAVEAEEAPWAGAARELAEELGWDRAVGRLLVVDYVRSRDGRPEAVDFVFDGGVLDENALDALVFPDREIVSARFCTLDEARARVTPLLADRLTAAVSAVGEGVTLLCDQGRPIA